MPITTIINAKVFDGETIASPGTVAIENGLFSEKTTGDYVIDGSGCTLLPGLIDSHTHIDNEEQLKKAAKAGLTTVMEMANHDITASPLL